MLKRFKKTFDNNFIENYAPFIPRLGSKYKSLIDDSWALFNYYILSKRKVSFGKIPDTLGIVSTTFCNAKCGYCAYRHLKDKKEILPFSTFKKIVDEFYSLGGRVIGLTPTVGDVLIDPNFFKKVEYLKTKGITSSLYTNAILLYKHINDFLLTPPDSLHIDLGDVIPEIDARIFGISPAQSKQRLNSVLDLLKEIDKRKIKFDLTLDFRGKRTPRKIIKDIRKSDFWKYYKKGLFTMAFLQSYDNWGGMISQKDLLGVQTLKLPPKFKKYPCKNLFVLSLLPNGEIRLCGCRCRDTLNDELVIGNLNKNSLKEIFASKKHQQIVSEFCKGNFPRVCVGCSFYRAKIPK